MKQLKLQQIISTVKSFITGEFLNNENNTPSENLKRGLIYKGVLAAVALILAVTMIFAMTAAWYSNIVQTTGLIFEVSDWGLDGNVDIKDQLTNAAPGEKGNIPVEVFNSSDGIINVGFSVSKVSLYNDIADMRKRLYFYIDDAATINNETTDRVYINSVEDYSYTVLSKQKLLLGNDGNGAALVWEWVYDVLGYYFYGTVTDSESAQISEYLRPIEYDFDSATFDNGWLETVDGKTTAMEFIEDITKKDGYEGVVTTEFIDYDGKVYYPVSVDDKGTGVWMYCCTLSEIEYENVVDTGLGSSTEESLKRFKTTLNVSAEQKKLNVATANSEQELKTIINDDVHNMVVLSDDIVLSDNINISAASPKIIDLADNTISSNIEGSLFTAQEGASLTLMNGEVKNIESKTKTAVNAVGGDVALSNVTLTGFKQSITITDHNATNQDTRLNMTDCKINSSEIGVFIKGNGPVTNRNTFLTMENCEIISDGTYALTGNGSAVSNGNWGTNIIIKNCLLQAKYTGIYHPQKDSYLKVEDSKVKGLTPFVVKGGKVDIIGTEITASNEEGTEALIQTPTLGNSGYSDTGAGLYVETGYDYGCNINISGETEITSYYSDAVLLFESDNPKYSILISGGNYSHNISEFLEDGYVCEQEGTRYLVREK